jgi:hypothetical protein
MFLRWPGRSLSIKASELRRRHERNRSRLLAVVLKKVVVPFSMRNKVIPSTLIHGTFDDRFHEDNDSISITSSISCISDGGGGDGVICSDEENDVGNRSAALQPDRGAAAKTISHENSTTVRKQSSRPHSRGQRQQTSALGREERGGLFISAPLLLPPPPSYYKPPQYYTHPTASTRTAEAGEEASQTPSSDSSIPLRKITFQKMAVALGYSNGRVDCKKLVHSFMQTIVTHWRVYAKKHKDVRRLGQFLQSCTKLRRLSKRFYHWLVRSSALAHRQSTWILPSQKQLPHCRDPSASLHGLGRVPPTHTQQPSRAPSLSQSCSSDTIRGKNNLSLGYAPPTAASRGSTMTLLDPYSHQVELPPTTRVLYEQETEGDFDELREESMDPYPLRTCLASCSTPSTTTSSVTGRRSSQTAASNIITGKSFIQPLLGVAAPPRPTHDQLYEVGKFYLGHRNVQYSHVVSEPL